MNSSNQNVLANQQLDQQFQFQSLIKLVSNPNYAQNLPNTRAPYLILIEQIMANRQIEPVLIFKQFLNKQNISPVQVQITPELENFLRKIQEKNKISPYQYLKKCIPYGEDFLIEDQDVQKQIFEALSNKGIQGLLEYAQDNLAPDVYDDFEQDFKDNKCQDISNYANFIVGPAFVENANDSSMMHQSKSQLNQSHVNNQSQVVSMNQKQLQILFQQIIQEMGIKVKYDEKFDAYIQEFQENLKINQSLGPELSLKKSGEIFASKKIARAKQEEFVSNLVERYPLQQSSQNVNNMLNESILSQRENFRQSSQDLIKKKQQLDEVDEREYQILMEVEEKQKLQFQTQLKKITSDSDNEEQKDPTILSQQVPNAEISDEEKDKKTSFFICVSSKNKNKPSMPNQPLYDVENFPESWTNVNPENIINPRFIKKSSDWVKVFQKWQQYLSREKQTEKKLKKYIGEMEQMVQQYRHKDQSKIAFLQVASFKSQGLKFSVLGEYLTKQIHNHLMISKRAHGSNQKEYLYDWFKVLPVLLDVYGNQEAANKLVLENMMNFDINKYIESNIIQGVQQVKTAIEIFQILSENTSFQAKPQEIMEYYPFFAQDKEIYKIFCYLIENKGLPQTENEFINHMEILILKNPKAAAKFLQYNMTKPQSSQSNLKENKEEFFQNVLNQLSFRIPTEVAQLVNQFDKFQEPEILKYSKFYAGANSVQNFQLFKKLIICKDNCEKNPRLFPIFVKYFGFLLNNEYSAAIQMYLNNTMLAFWPKVINRLSLLMPLKVRDFLKDLELNIKTPEIIQYIQFFQNEQSEIFANFRDLIFSKQLLEEEKQFDQSSFEALCYNFQKILVYKQEAALFFLNNNREFPYYEKVFEKISYIIPKVLNQFIEQNQVLKICNLQQKPELLNYVSFFEKVKDPLSITLIKLIELKKLEKTESYEFQQAFTELIQQKFQAAIQFVSLNRGLQVWNKLFDQVAQDMPIEIYQVYMNFKNHIQQPEVLAYYQFYTSMTAERLNQEAFNLTKQLLNLEGEPAIQAFILNHIRGPYYEIPLYYMIRNNYPLLQQIIDQISVTDPERTADICRKLQAQDVQINFPEIILYTDHINQSFAKEDMMRSLQKYSKIKEKLNKNKSVDENKQKLFKKLIKQLTDQDTKGFAVEWLTNNHFHQFNYSELLDKLSMENLETCKMSKSIIEQVKKSNFKQQYNQLKLQQSTNPADNQEIQENLKQLDDIASNLAIPELVYIVDENPNINEEQFQILAQLQRCKTEYLQNQGVEEVRQRYFKQLIKFLENAQTRPMAVKFLEKNFNNDEQGSTAFNVKDQNDFLNQLSCHSLQMLKYTNDFYEQVMSQGTDEENLTVTVPELTLYVEEIGDSERVFKTAQELQQIKKGIVEKRSNLSHSQNKGEDSQILKDKIMNSLQNGKENQRLVVKWLKLNADSGFLTYEELQEVLDDISGKSLELCQSSQDIWEQINKTQNLKAHNINQSIGTRIQLNQSPNYGKNGNELNRPELTKYIQDVNGDQASFNIVKELVQLKKNCENNVFTSYDNQRNKEILEQKIIYELSKPGQSDIVYKFLEKNSNNFDWSNLLETLAQKDPKLAYQVYENMVKFNPNLKAPEIFQYIPYFQNDAVLQEKVNNLLRLKNNPSKIVEFEQSLQQLSQENYEVYRKFIDNNQSALEPHAMKSTMGSAVVFYPNFDLKESFQKMEEAYKSFKWCKTKMSQNVLKVYPKLIFCPGKNQQNQSCMTKFTNVMNLAVLKCPDCQHVFCSQCYQPSHTGKQCDEFLESADQLVKKNFEKEVMRQKQLQQQENESRKKYEIQDWILGRQDFGNLAQIFFNLLNRGDDWENVIKVINNEVKKEQMQLPFNFNKKLLFYLYLQNSDEIRQYKSIEQHARYSDVPLFYPKWPSNQGTSNIELEASHHSTKFEKEQKNHKLFGEYTINTSVYLITEPSTSILSFGLGKSSKYPSGKSQFLNYVFDKNFQTDDRSPFSARTIDIDFDNAFRPTRSLAIADVNGVFEQKHYKPFFNLFQFVILHIKYQDLQNSDLNQKISDVLQFLQASPLHPILCLIVRDFPQHQIHERRYVDTNQERAAKILQLTEGGKVFSSYKNLQVFLMENQEKIQVREEKVQAMDEVKNAIFKSLQKIVDKRALNKDSILGFFKHYNNSIEIEQVQIIKNNIMAELYKYQNDFFDEHIFPCRNLMKKIKQTKNQIWKGTNKQSVNNHQHILKQLESQLANAPLSDLMRNFLQLVVGSPNWYQIIIDLSREISQFSSEKLTELKRHKEKIQKKYEQILSLADQEDQYQGDYFKDRLAVEDEKNRANERVEQQILSIEIFWRELFSLLEYNNQQLSEAKIDPLERMFEFAGYGESFEIIDGDNMQVNKQQLSQLAEKFKQSRILVLSILGPQSSGKSTLLNYLFGCQFSSSVGRCTRGVYGSLVKVDRDHLVKILKDLEFQGISKKTIDEKAFDYLLVLDTEGLQDPAKPNTEFDRTITLFCFSVSQILLINFKGEITREMKKLLEICVYSLHTLRKTRIIGNEVFMVFNQNAHVNDITPLKEQITNMKSNIIEANKKAAHEAELLCSGRDGQVVALGSAFKEDQYPANEFVWEQWKRKVPQSSFAMDCQALAEHVFGGFLRQKAEWNFSSWLKMAQGIWNFIELYPGLLEFEDIMQLKQENDFREEIEIQKKQYLSQRPADVVQQQIKLLQEKYGKSNLTEIYENVKLYIGEMYNEANVLINKNLSQFCEERNLDAKLLQNKLQQIKDFISNQEKEAMFHLSDYLQKGKTNSYKKEGIQSINEKIKQYQQNFPYKEIDEYLMMKYQKQRNEISMEQYNQVIQEWAEFKFEELWTRIIDDLTGKLNLEENCYDLIYNHLEEFYKKKEKNIVTTHFRHKVKAILLQDENQKLSPQSLVELQQFFITNIIKDKNQVIFKKKITDKFDQNLNLILRQLDRHGNFLNLKPIFQIKVQRRYIERKQIPQLFNGKKLLEVIQKLTSQISITAGQQVKERIGNQLTTEIQGILYKMGLELIKPIEGQIAEIFKKKYASEQSRAQDVYNVIMDGKVPRVQILPEGGGFNYREMRKNYNIYSFFPEFEKALGVIEWEYQNIDQASDQTKVRNQQIQSTAAQNPTFLFDIEENMVYLDTFGPSVRKQYELGLQFLITKDIGVGAKQEVYQQLANLARDQLKWDEITEEIWTMLEEKLSLPASTPQDQQGMDKLRNSRRDDSWQDISKFSSETVESAFQQVEHIIEKANKDLEYIGQELDQLGTILVHYFGMVICWKILCYSYMNIYKQPILDLEADKQQWKTTFISQICSDSTKICENLAERVAKDFIRNIKQTCKQEMFTSDFLIENFSHLKSIFTSRMIMLKTDLQIFNLKIDKNDEDFQETFDNQIMAYIKDPKPFLELVFEDEWKRATEGLINQSKMEYRKNVKQYLQQATTVVDELIGMFYRLQYKRKSNAKEYFKIDKSHSSQEEEEMNELYKMAAFHLIKDIFDGKDIDENWKWEIKTQIGQSLSFTPQNIKKIALQQVDIFSSVQWTNEEQNLQVIPFPIYFLESLLQKLTSIQDSFEVSYHDLGIADIYTDCRTQSIGCLKQCNFCGRKCDKPPNVEHKHGCHKTHQVRGMKGVRYGKTLSNKICDEIKMDQVVHVENNGKITKVKWGDICKSSCPDWNFMKENPDEKYQINFTDVWNKYAEFFCNHYKQFYQEEINVNLITYSQKYHYIICMDDSGSMYGQKWTNAKMACINFIKDSQKYHEGAQIEAKISVVKFSNVAKLVYGPEQLDPKICQDKLNFEGGGTDFYEPLHIAIDQIYQHRNQFTKHIIMMYTDGYARYPGQLKKELNQLPKDVYQSIEFKSWSEQDASVLSDIAKLFVVGEAFDNVKTDDLGFAFIEILNAVQHGITF